MFFMVEPTTPVQSFVSERYHFLAPNVAIIVGRSRDVYLLAALRPSLADRVCDTGSD